VIYKRQVFQMAIIKLFLSVLMPMGCYSLKFLCKIILQVAQIMFGGKEPLH
jgi:hypothetical protein